jgi:rhodanese-related sulfurtransferase
MKKSGNIGKEIRMKRIKSIYAVLLIITGLNVLLPASMLSAQDASKVKKIMSIDAYDRLKTWPDTFLIDVRTREEYQFTGHPENAYLFPYMMMTGKLVKTDDRYEYQYNLKNSDFLAEINKVFKKTDNLLIICREGKRSAMAAKELAEDGFENVFDVEDGFEGREFPYFEEPNQDKMYKNLARQNKINGYRQRRHYGWQFWGLPWTYEMDPNYLYPPDLPKP